MVCLPQNLMQSPPEITISFTSIDKVKHIISEDIIETSINMLVCHHTTTNRITKIVINISFIFGDKIANLITISAIMMSILLKQKTTGKKHESENNICGTSHATSTFLKKGKNKMLNIAKSAKIIQKELDKQTLENATSGWMEENITQTIYSGGCEIKMPKTDVNDFDACITYIYETLKLARERNKRFCIDKHDIDKENIAQTITAVISEFQRTQVNPEIDAYRYSRLAAAAGIRENYIPNKATITARLLNQLSKVRSEISDKDDIVIVMSRHAYDKLIYSDKVSQNIETSQFRQGELDLYVKSIDNVYIIPVPSTRMKTAYTFNDNEGFAAIENAKEINWIICPRTTPIAISKTDNIVITTPETNQFDPDLWDVDYSKYYDLFIPDNKKATIAVSIRE